MLIYKITDITEMIGAMAAMGAVVVSLLNRSKIQEVKIDVNSRMSQLLELTKESSFAKGIQHQVQHPVDVAIVQDSIESKTDERL